MAWRTIFINHPAQLSVEDEHLKIKQFETNLVPLDDIHSVVLANRRVNLTAPLLGKLGEYNIALFSSDDKYLPNGVFHSFMPHSRQSKIVREQIKWKGPFRKKMQQKIVQNKIHNQAKVLQQLYQTGDDILKLIPLVGSGDPKNIEAQASAKYFKQIFKKFNRQQDNLHNAALNYAYAIVRGITARVVVGGGFLPCLGLFHHSELNAFNLVDDLMEPFRPMVDKMVHQLLGEDPSKSIKSSDRELNSKHKQELIKIVFTLCSVDKKVLTLHHALEIFIRSLSSASQYQNTQELLTIELVE